MAGGPRETRRDETSRHVRVKAFIIVKQHIAHPRDFFFYNFFSLALMTLAFFFRGPLPPVFFTSVA